MITNDPDTLNSVVARFIDGRKLTPSERAEVLRIAQGFACKDSAMAGDVSPETIRARRKRIYRKMDLNGSGELVARLLGLSLGMLANGERVEAAPAFMAFPVNGSAQQAQPASF
jgi:DNA-binding CsgD family transcriptional regulator